MLAQKNRFHRRNHVKYVYAKGKSIRSDSLTLKYLRNQKHADFRVAVVVSKKVSKSAVKRNRIRRRIYEVVRKHQPLASDSDMVFTAFDVSLATMPATTLENTVVFLLKKAGITE